MSVMIAPIGRGSSMKCEQGVAMLTVLLIMLMLTVLGISAVTVTGLENRMAGFMTSMEGANTAAESCTGIGVNIIQQTIDPYVGAGSIPASFQSNVVTAGVPGPVPQLNAALLTQEIMGQSDNNNDIPDGVGENPNLSQTIGAFTVKGDIDRLYIKGTPGSGMQQFAGYEGAGNSAASSANIFYRVDCVARNTTTGTSARVTAVYACTVTGESCQK